MIRKTGIFARTLGVSGGCFLFILVCLGLGNPLWAGKTVMKNGTWISNNSPFLVQAEFDGKFETICLPKLDYIEPVDGAELQKKMKEGIIKQGAVFHLYQDGLGSPVRKGGMFFASDVFLKELKMTYSDTIQSWGYKFKVSTKPAYDDSAYMLAVQSGAGEYGSSGKDKKGSGRKLVVPSEEPLGISEVMPGGALPFETRKMKQALEKKIREIKSRPFKSEVLRVDVVRWASGRMGKLGEEGRIAKASVEGVAVDCLISPPKEKSWLTDELLKEVASQPCEFILQRDINGREAQRDGAYILADIYFTDLASTWDEWLTSHKLTPKAREADPNLATSPVILKIAAVDGTWKNLKSPNLGIVSLKASEYGAGGEEILRLTPFENPIKSFKELVTRLGEKTAGKPVTVSLILSPDGKPYVEIGQKRASRISFPEQKTTLMILMKEMTEGGK